MFNEAIEPKRGSYAAIVVHFRTPRALAACIDALRRQTHQAQAIIVVDNSPLPEDLSGRPQVRDEWVWIPTERNLGFGAACNLGARGQRADFLLFLNADVALENDACELLCATGDGDSAIGVVGPRIIAADGSIELSARAFPTIRTAILGRSSLLTSALRALKRTPAGVAAALGESDCVDWVSGACMLVRRSSFEAVGGFDESYWMYWEDADLCRRLGDGGWKTMLCAAARAYHETGSSGRSPETVRAFHRSAARYYERHVARMPFAAGTARLLLALRMKIALARHASRRAT